jgi:hypothetical protein
MLRWRERGVEILDTAGGGEYKLKYGPKGELHVPHLRRARIPGLLRARNLAERVVRRRKLQEPTAAAQT